MDDEKQSIMLVDDNPANLRAGKNVLSEKYTVFTAPSAAKMFGLLANNKPALILLDIEMPEMNGYEAIKILKSKAETADIPVIFLTGRTDPNNENEGLSLGAVEYITKPFLPALLLKRLGVHLLVDAQKQTLETQKLMLEAQQQTLESQKLKLEAQQRELKNFNDNFQKMVDDKTTTVLELQNAILKTIAELVEYRDDITGSHIERTRHVVSALFDVLKRSGAYREETSDWDIELLLQSSQLHDVGKIAISDNILKKPGRLTDEEFTEMKKHTAFGIQVIEKIEAATSENDFLRHAKVFAGTHHEKWDGTGYPQGLRGTGIPLQGRIMAIADVYDALVSERPYKKAFTHDEAVEIIRNARGTQFDPMLVDMFLEAEGQFR
jgi:putative two-component system response regulator